MGLDMYAYKAKKEYVKPSKLHPLHWVHIEDPEKENEWFIAENSNVFIDLGYWRKFNALHAYMEDLYKNQGGKDEFNCIMLHLTEDDLNDLEKNLNNPEPVEGFFSGLQEIHSKDIKTTKVFIKEAKEAIKEGYMIFYDSWW